VGHIVSCAPQAAAPAASDAPAAAAEGERKLWGGRFTGKTDPLMEKFNESLPFDKRMWAEDIRVCASSCPAPRLTAAGRLRKPWLVGVSQPCDHCWSRCFLLQGSQAYAKALAKAGILTSDEATTIVDALGKVRATGWQVGKCVVCRAQHSLRRFPFPHTDTACRS
jgi:argininosuccinate lyase